MTPVKTEKSLSQQPLVVITHLVNLSTYDYNYDDDDDVYDGDGCAHPLSRPPASCRDVCNCG